MGGLVEMVVTVGKNQNIFANSSPVNFDLSGEDGEDGYRPNCDREHDEHGKVAHDITLPIPLGAT